MTSRRLQLHPYKPSILDNACDSYLIVATWQFVMCKHIHAHLFYQDLLQSYIGRFAVLSSLDTPLAVDSLLLTDVAGYAPLTVKVLTSATVTLEQVLACKESFLSAGTVVVTHKSAEGVWTKPLFQALAIYSIYCDVFVMQMKFYNCHMKRSKI